VIVNHGVHERRSNSRTIVRRGVSALTCAVAGGDGIAFALLSAEELVAAAVGNVGELSGSPVTRSIRDSRLIRHRVSTACTVEAGMPMSPAICTGPSRRRHRNRTIRRTTSGLVFAGLVRGRELRSAIPAAPSCRKRSAHFLAVRGETMNILAAPA
jgi:hypothetical protein